MPGRPETVRFVAGTFWIVGAAAASALAAIHFGTRHLPIGFHPIAYQITGGIAALYLMSGTLIWFGWQPGPALGRLCLALFVLRPRILRQLSDSFRAPDFQAHFQSPSRE